MGLVDGDISILDHLPTLSPERANEISNILEIHELKAADMAEANDGAHELVAYLRAKRIPFGIVTNNAERHVLKMAEKNKYLVRSFDHPGYRLLEAGPEAPARRSRGNRRITGEMHRHRGRQIRHDGRQDGRNVCRFICRNIP